MGKYMKKSKITGDVAVMEVISQSTTLGVRTRAKTLALQRLQPAASPTTAAESVPNPDSNSFCYLQLRSRRLEKPLPLCETKKAPPPSQPEGTKVGNLSSRRSSRLRRVSSEKSSAGGCCGGGFEDEREEVEGCLGKKEEVWGLKYEEEDCGVEASFGENCLEFEARERSTRESTPCSLIRESDTIATPGSTTRQTTSTATNRRVRNNIQRNIPTAHEMEQFFACAEEQQQRLFANKYNYDVVNDLPLPGRYEWIPVNP